MGSMQKTKDGKFQVFNNRNQPVGDPVANREVARKRLQEQNKREGLRGRAERERSK